MSLCHARFSATQYACLSALTACGRVFAGPVAAYVVDGWGWIMLYGWAFILSFPGLIVLYLLRLNERVYNEEVVVKT